jgi:AraC-like DNA-binding protein
MLTDTLSANAVPCFSFDNHAPARALPALNRTSGFDKRSDSSWPVRPYHRAAGDAADAVVQFSPAEVMTRRTLTWKGMGADFVQSATRERIECHFRAPFHLLAVCEHGVRLDGETFVEGLARSKLRDFSRTLTFVPAGHEFHEWQVPRSRTSMLYFYFDPATLQGPELDVADVFFPPRLFFEDATLWETALKLKRSVESLTSENRPYSEALSVVLVHELVRLNRGMPRSDRQVRGGLAAWQQRIVTAYIEEHLADQVPLATLAQLVRLSPYHFCRAFKQSFGLPPHRYHTNRRIERAKTLLATPASSVTDIGFTVGFSETSSFTAAFRRVTGLTPTGYRRGLA